MLLFGHPLLESEKFYHISDVGSVVKTPPNGVIYLEFSKENLDIVNYLRSNSIRFALEVANIKDAILAYNLGADFIVVAVQIAGDIQKIAETYLFDAKILARSDDEAMIEEAALIGIDGVLFPTAVVKISG